MKNAILFGILAISLLLFGCAQAPAATATPAPTLTATATPSIEATATPTAAPVTGATPTPTPTAVATATEQPGATASENTTANQKATPSTTPSEPATPSPVATANVSQAPTATIHIKNMAFTPKILNVTAGTKVTWINEDTVTHAVTADNNAFESGNLEPGRNFTFLFIQNETETYHCNIHFGMKGNVTVG